MSGIARVEVEVGAFERMRRLGAAAYPHEGCGVLVGSLDAAEVRVVDVTSARNLFTSRLQDRFDLDPADMLRADRDARGRGLDVVGVWHTHPDHPARPSAFDNERAWLGWVYVIMSTAVGGVGDVNAFALESEGGPFVQIELAVGEQARP